MGFISMCNKLKAKIESAYTEGVTVLEAERLAAEFLHAQMAVSEELKNADLSSRMRKSGVKGVKAALYLNEVQKADKKPTEAQLTALIDSNEVVQGEQDAYDKAEVDSAELDRLYNIFREAHIYFRGVAKGKFE